jgi:hypothetical protein
MLSRHCDKHDIPPARAVIVPSATTWDATASGNVDVISRGPGRRLRIRNAVVAACSCAAGGSAGYALGGPVLAAAGFMAVVLLCAAIAIVLSAMLGRSDLRSPFERLMLLICVVTGRRPRDYLPAAATQKRPTVGSGLTAPAVTVMMPKPGDVAQEQIRKADEGAR